MGKMKAMVVGSSCPLGEALCARLDDPVRVDRRHGIDLLSQDIPLEMLDGVEEVYWLAQHRDPHAVVDLFRVNVPRLPRRVRRVVLASSGTADGSYYAQSKRFAEDKIPYLADEAQAVRIFSLWGPGQERGVVWFARQAGRQATNTRSVITPVHLEDVAEAMVRLRGRGSCTIDAAGPTTTIGTISGAEDDWQAADFPVGSTRDLERLGIVPRGVA